MYLCMNVAHVSRSIYVWMQSKYAGSYMCEHNLYMYLYVLELVQKMTINHKWISDIGVGKAHQRLVRKSHKATVAEKEMGGHY